MNEIYNIAYKSSRAISFMYGIVKSVNRASRFNADPLINCFGIHTGDTSYLGAAKYAGRSSGCGKSLFDAYISTIGETIERYCPAFFDPQKLVESSYDNLGLNAVPPSEYSMFHESQLSEFEKNGRKMQPFNNETVLYWDKCIDLTNGKETYCPATFLYLPWLADRRPILYGVSTGLAAHSNFHKAVLTGLWEAIERDSFVLTWFQKIVPPKLYITEEIHKFINQIVPEDYEWNFFDITYDLGVPTVFGICLGKSDYGDFIAVGTATRSTLGEALKKTILEIAQTIPYFRYCLRINKNWTPTDNFNELNDFEKHSIFYIKRPEYRNVFDRWLKATPSKMVDLYEKCDLSAQESVLKIVKILKEHNYNVLLKDLTTIDAQQCGMFCVRVVVPQLLQMTGSYEYYPLGGKRLYEVPEKMGYVVNDYEHLNKFPHPFP
jgi:ribosomal protein S12 methylthiotransferase accessory factor